MMGLGGGVMGSGGWPEPGGLLPPTVILPPPLPAQEQAI